MVDAAAAWRCVRWVHRFDEFQENLKISSSMLTSRLKSLVSAGLFERQQYSTNPPRFEYVLTELGRSLRPVLVAFAAWGNSPLDPSEPSMILVDVQTGEEVDPVVVDRTTGRALNSEQFVFAAGPAASPEMRAHYSRVNDWIAAAGSSSRRVLPARITPPHRSSGLDGSSTPPCRPTRPSCR